MDNFKRVKKDSPCPVCGRADWCLVAPDGSAAICQRVESSRKIGDAGFLHRLISANTPTYSGIRCHEMKVAPAEMVLLAKKCHADMTPARWLTLSGELDVSVESLRRLRAGWDGQAFTFPMRTAEGAVCGIRRRFPNGAKVSVKGSHNGLFVPSGLTGEGLLIIAEGPSDCAAGIDLGFDTVGRPNCNSLESETIRYFRRCNYSRVVVVPDADEPGVTGADKLARRLRLHSRDVRQVIPPQQYNDLRGWLKAGLTRETLDNRIEAAEAVVLEIKQC